MLSKLKPRSTAVRLSFGLVALTLSVISVAQVLGIFPDTTQALIDGRVNLCKAIGVHCAAAVQNDVDIDNLNAVTSSMVAQNSDVLSVGIRSPEGQLLIQSGPHEALWEEAPAEGSTPDYVRVPIIKDAQPWGTIEICFEPLYGGGLLGWFRHPVIGTMLFMGMFGFILFIFYLRRTLKILNPQAVIPQRIQAMLNTLAEGLVVLDGREQIVLANEAFAAMVGGAADQLQGKRIVSLPWQPTQQEESENQDSEEAADTQWPWSPAVHQSQTQIGVPLKMTTPEQGIRTLMVNAAPIVGGDGSTRGALVTFDDVTAVEKKNVQLNELVGMLKQHRDEISEKNEELKRLATRDPLTGCFNRRSLFEQFDSLWRMAQEQDKNLGCVMFDIDRFKSINDTHGHAVGDQVLREIAEVLQSTVDEMDVVARYGGEEFCVLIRHGSIEQAAELAERIRQAIEARHCAGLDVTSSFGASSKSMGATSTKELLEQADQALYAAKHGGRNQVIRWDQMPDESEADQAAAHRAEAQDKEQEMSYIPYQTVTGLLAALTQRDADVGQHSKRVADLAVLVAKEQLSPRDCFILEVAALLHDLGKLSVPDSILMNLSPLSEDELRITRLHDEMAVVMINATFNCTDLTRIVETYNAWFAGHPARPELPTSTDIPYGARVIAIADAFDVLMSGKDGHRESAFSELRRCAGTQFDPDLVERFIEVVAAREDDDAATTTAVSPQSAVEIDQALKQLVSACEGQDFTSLGAIAGQLKVAAASKGLDRIAQLATELEEAAGTESDLADAARLAAQLIDVCQSAQVDPATQSEGSDATDMSDTEGGT